MKGEEGKEKQKFTSHVKSEPKQESASVSTTKDAPAMQNKGKKDDGHGTAAQAKSAEPDTEISRLDELETKAAILENENARLKEELAKCDRQGDLLKQLDEQKQSYLRLYADFENYRKRVLKEQKSAADFGKGEVMESLLGVLDNFHRALEAPKGSEEFAKGVQMIFQQLKDALEKQGLCAINTEGMMFDPNVHNAVLTTNDPEIEDGMVSACMQTGYMFKDKVLRPAMVQVNKRED